MANLLDTCPTCFEITLNECADFIVIEGGFIVFEDYVIIITDKFGHEYRLNLTAGYDGELTIDVTDLPDGLFTAYSGVFAVKIYESDGCTPATITFCEDVYTCLKLTFKTVLLESDDDIFEYIKCCEEEPVSSITLAMSQTCVEGLPYYIMELDVVNTSGDYVLERLIDDVWTLFGTRNGLAQNGHIEIEPLTHGGLLLYDFRVTSGDVISNIVPFQLTPCP